ADYQYRLIDLRPGADRSRRPCAGSPLGNEARLQPIEACPDDDDLQVGQSPEGNGRRRQCRTPWARGHWTGANRRTDRSRLARFGADSAEGRTGSRHATACRVGARTRFGQWHLSQKSSGRAAKPPSFGSGTFGARLAGDRAFDVAPRHPLPSRFPAALSPLLTRAVRSILVPVVRTARARRTRAARVRTRSAPGERKPRARGSTVARTPFVLHTSPSDPARASSPVRKSPPYRGWSFPPARSPSPGV